ncbi:hypothetical protein [Plasmodium yoelii yoelii]|uniref:Uncharacterized protein n=1 Tax=Plasmodium yoelii yoelii TaxID=73239 RepID=Q7RR01_PLAYO|nr:hypothetical protein [Plasmodium yoelii yoelii]
MGNMYICCYNSNDSINKNCSNKYSNAENEELCVVKTHA